MIKNLKRKLITQLLKDDFLKEETFAKLLDNRKIISDFRVGEFLPQAGEVINIPDNVVFYHSVISNSVVNTNKINAGAYVTIANNLFKH